MHIQLENTESQKAQKKGDLIRSYNRSKREVAEASHLICILKMNMVKSWLV